MKIIDRKKVREMTNLSFVTIWRLERSGNFPARIQLSPNRVGWIEEEVLLWIASRPRK